MQTIKKGRPPKYFDPNLIDKDGLFVPGSTPWKRELIQRSARAWGRNNGVKIRATQQENNNGKRIGVLISLVE